MFKAHSKPFEDIVVLELDKQTALALHGALIVSAFGQQVADGEVLNAIEAFLTGRVVEIGSEDAGLSPLDEDIADGPWADDFPRDIGWSP